MVREVQANVPQSRLMLLSPTVPFIPLFRAIPLLQERDLGVFAPVWPTDMTSLPYPALPPLTDSTSIPPAAVLPFLPTWPWRPDPKARISPALSSALKERRKVDISGGHAVEIPHPAVPELRLDTRKWENVTLDRLTLERVSLPEGSVAYLETPLMLQEHPDRESLVDRVFHLLEQQGYWHFYDILPASMPAHWLYTHFPAAWSLARGVYWNAYQFYNALRKAGLHVRQQEHTFYQPVSLNVAWKIAQQRSGLLKLLNDDAYRLGLDQLAEAVQEGKGETLIGSEIALVEVTAVKGKPPKRKRRGRRKA
jgi:hypothetical protein